MALDFPANPVEGQVYRYPDPLTGPSTYIFNGTVWYVAASNGSGPDPVPGGTVTNVLGLFPIVSNQTPPQPEIAINQAGLNTSEFNNDANFITNPVEDLEVTNSFKVKKDDGGTEVAIKVQTKNVDGDTITTASIRYDGVVTLETLNIEELGPLTD